MKGYFRRAESRAIFYRPGLGLNAGHIDVWYFYAVAPPRRDLRGRYAITKCPTLNQTCCIGKHPKLLLGLLLDQREWNKRVTQLYIPSLLSPSSLTPSPPSTSNRGCPVLFALLRNKRLTLWLIRLFYEPFFVVHQCRRRWMDSSRPLRSLSISFCLVSWS